MKIKAFQINPTETHKIVFEIQDKACNSTIWIEAERAMRWNYHGSEVSYWQIINETKKRQRHEH